MNKLIYVTLIALIFTAALLTILVEQPVKSQADDSFTYAALMKIDTLPKNPSHLIDLFDSEEELDQCTDMLYEASEALGRVIYNTVPAVQAQLKAKGALQAEETLVACEGFESATPVIDAIKFYIEAH